MIESTDGTLTVPQEVVSRKFPLPRWSILYSFAKTFRSLAGQAPRRSRHHLFR